MKKIEIKNLKVQKTLDYKQRIIYLYEVPLKSIFNQNIVCKSPTGEIIWQVKDIFEDLTSQDSPFTNIEHFNEDKFIAYNFIGGAYYVSIKTGELQLINKVRY